jgi:hypothetical protein
MAGEVVQQCRINLKKLKDISSSGTKGLADPELRQLRETVRETCLKALQLEYENAQVRFHRQIIYLITRQGWR